MSGPLRALADEIRAAGLDVSSAWADRLERSADIERKRVQESAERELARAQRKPLPYVLAGLAGFLAGLGAGLLW